MERVHRRAPRVGGVGNSYKALGSIPSTTGERERESETQREIEKETPLRDLFKSLSSM
jgi:hypothetical protein